MRRLAIITTHPIQYYAPLFRLLHERGNIAVKVFYTWEKEASLYDKDFGREVKWDIPLLEGYEYEFVSNNGNHGRDFRSVRNPGLIRAIEDWGAQAVLLFGWNYHSHLKVMRHFKGRIPVLFRGDSTLLNEKPGLKRIARRLFLRWVYRHVDTAVYVGINNKHYFEAHGLKEDQLVFAPHAIDNSRFFDSDGLHEQEAARWKNELGILKQDRILIFVGKLQDTKDPMLLLESFVEADNPGWHLLFVGNGELEAKLKEAALGRKNVHFQPFQNQSRMPVVYRIGDVFCLPSKGETWGLAVNEAMASGLPLLLSDKCGCTADLLVDGRNGLGFESGNKQDLVDKIRTLKTVDHQIEDMGIFSAEMISAWSYDQVVSAIERIVLQ